MSPAPQITYNTNGRPPTQPLHELLGFSRDFYGRSHLPDLLAVGLQELPITSLFTHEPWTRHISHILSAWDYVRLKQHRMHGILLLLYCKRSLVPEVRALESVDTRTGVSRIVGSKGAVSISCKVSGVSLVVTCAHLSPHEEQCESRVRGYATVIDEQVFRKDGQANGILTHDYAIFMGDLNFRINSMTEEAVHEAALSHGPQVVTQLLQWDQLSTVRREGSAFSEFREPQVSFMPTYKFFVGTCHYDLCRKPAYTDRILFRSIDRAYEDQVPGLRLDLSPLCYNSHPDYLISDHKPVSALFVFKAFNRRVYEHSGLTEPTRITFLPLSDWKNADYNTVWFTCAHMSRDLTSDDFLSIFPADFSSLDEEIHRSYVNPRPETKLRPPGLHASHDHVHNAFWYKTTFSPSVTLQSSTYRLLYFNSRFGDVFSMSPPFDVP